MKELIAVLLALVMCSVMMISYVSADSVIVDYGDVAGELGDVDVDTFITVSDLVTLRQILIAEIQPQSRKTANVNGTDGIDIRDLVGLKKFLAEKKSAYFAGGITTVYGNESDKNTWIYKVNSSGLYVRDVEIDLGTGDRSLVLTHTSDWHVGAMVDSDFNDAQISASYHNRKTAFPDAVKNARKAMEFGNLYGKTIITGDTTDFLSMGSFNAVKSIIGKSDVVVTLGNHEFRKVWYGDYKDTMDADQRYTITQDNWPNNIFYHSEIVNNKVMLISIYNAAGNNTDKYYTKAFTAKDALGRKKTDTVDNFFAGDLAIAEANGYVVLLFQHMPTSTGKPEDASFTTITGKTVNMYKFSGNSPTDTDMDRAMYKLITENASLIKGIFNGDIHDHIYSEVLAKSTPDATEYDSVIPQYTAGLNAHGNGCVNKITVKY